ncbi:hypothetical protein [Streptomyces sp. WM6378]|uniref:hypothetical protein n=1 Tax=Streptomyces sp. WM6378 TaxID=1415557 RepID=UPI0006AE2172|nr:hypothetical protein [Streptomyces sp. WM6378]KOU38056.1 hypothetical protein ADK54_30095 [Streptomyces sp. WM6378]
MHLLTPLTTIEEDRNPAVLRWTVDWQRHYVGLKALLDDRATARAVRARVTYRGDDTGRRPARQQSDLGRLNAEQQKQLAELGIDWA